MLQRSKQTPRFNQQHSAYPEGICIENRPLLICTSPKIVSQITQSLHTNIYKVPAPPSQTDPAVWRPGGGYKAWRGDGNAALTAEPAASSVGETADSINIAEVLG